MIFFSRENAWKKKKKLLLLGFSNEIRFSDVQSSQSQPFCLCHIYLDANKLFAAGKKRENSCLL